MEMQSVAGFFFAFIAVLALIGLAAWLARRFAGNRLGAGANRGRMPRLAVVDAAAVDGRRRLVLVRRDNIEHLLMIGGPSDIVVEPNIVRATPPQQQMPPRAPLPPAHEQAWDSEAMRPEPLDEPMPLPEPPPRPARPAFADEMRRTPAPEEMRRAPAPEEMRRAPPVERRPDPLAGFSAEPMVRQEPAMREAAPPPRPAPRAPEPPPLGARPPRAEPPKAPPSVRPAERPTPPAVPTPTAAADKNLAEMAQRLEAALRRPGAPPATPDRAPPVAPEGPSARAAPPRPSSEPAPAVPSESDNAAADAPKTQFKNLEDEMASLLGRPKTPS
jgi:flagellar protein FliO/FliZ